MKIREVIRRLEEDGWFPARTRGSRRQFHHSTKAGAVTVAERLRQDLHPKRLAGILRQAGLKSVYALHHHH